MPDITMCADKKCPMRKKCYRFTAVPTPDYQAYASFGRRGKECCAFSDNSGYPKRKKV